MQPVWQVADIGFIDLIDFAEVWEGNQSATAE